MYDSNLYKIYVIYHTPYLKIPTEIFTPIYTRSGVSEASYLASDTLDNISCENTLYAEYTTLYWVWKNDLTSKYVGFFQYKRFLSFNELLLNSGSINQSIIDYKWNKEDFYNLIDNYDILLPSHMDFNPKSVIEQYQGYHGTIFMQTALEVIERKYNDFIEDCNDVLYGSVGCFCNMFIMRRDLFNEYMAWIMDIFTEIKLAINPAYVTKDFAYLGERLFNCYIHYLKRTRTLRIKEIPLVLMYPNESGDATFTVHMG